MFRFCAAASVGALLAGLASPPPARADACAPIAAAFEKLATVPAYRQVIREFGKKPVTSLAVGQKFFVQAEGEWQALELKPGARLAMMKAAVGIGLEGCVEEAGETLDGVAVKVFTYKPPKKAAAEGAMGQTLWVGADDGLPRRIFSETVEVQLSYDDVKAPPVAQQ